jgi:hypothetical protein
VAFFDTHEDVAPWVVRMIVDTLGLDSWRFEQGAAGESSAIRWRPPSSVPHRPLPRRENWGGDPMNVSVDQIRAAYDALGLDPNQWRNTWRITIENGVEVLRHNRDGHGNPQYNRAGSGLLTERISIPMAAVSDDIRRQREAEQQRADAVYTERLKAEATLAAQVYARGLREAEMSP